MKQTVLILISVIALAFSSCRKFECPPAPDSGSNSTSSTNNTNLKLGLIAYFPFNGNAGDSSGFNNHGTVNGALLTADRFGNSYHAYHFDGNMDYIHIGNNPILKRYQSDYTMAAWVKLESFGTTYGTVLLSNRNHNVSPTSGSMFGFGGQLSSQFKKFQTVQNALPSNDIYGYDYSFSTQDTPLNLWIHVAITYKYNGGGANDCKTYINGVLDASDTMKEILDPVNSPTIIGCEPILSPPEYSLNASLDEVRIYNRVLSADEMLQLYNLIH